MEIGTLLEPRYGLSVQHENFYKRNDKGYSQHLREMIFEEVRLNTYPGKPSRLNSIYLVESLKEATQYAIKFGFKYIYGVTIESSGPLHNADMYWIDISVRKPYEDLKKLANNYYSGKFSDNPFKEILFKGDVMVVERFTREDHFIKESE